MPIRCRSTRTPSRDRPDRGPFGALGLFFWRFDVQEFIQFEQAYSFSPNGYDVETYEPGQIVECDSDDRLYEAAVSEDKAAKTITKKAAEANDDSSQNSDADDDD